MYSGLLYSTDPDKSGNVGKAIVEHCLAGDCLDGAATWADCSSVPPVLPEGSQEEGEDEERRAS